jgi:hypothetical protein
VVSYLPIISHNPQFSYAASAEDHLFLLSSFLRLLNNFLCLGGLLLAGSALLCAFDLVLEFLKGIGNALAEGWEDGFSFFDCGALRCVSLIFKMSKN